MPLISGSPEQGATPGASRGRRLSFAFLRLPRNVYILLCFTLGKGFQLSIATLAVNYYAHSLGYRQDFIGLLSAMPAIGSLAAAVPVGFLADRLGRKIILISTAVLTPLFLAGIGLGTSASWLLACAFMQGVVSTAYWVTNLPLLTESTTERQRVGVFALNSFLLLGIGALGSLLGGAIPEFVGHVLHVAAGSPVPLRWGILIAALSTFVFGLPLWFLRETRHTQPAEHTYEHEKAVHSTPLIAPVEIAPAQSTVLVAPVESAEKPALAAPLKERLPAMLFVKLLSTDLLFTMGEGAVVALIQIYFVLRFHLSPGTLGIIFSISGLAGGVFSLTAPLFVHRWSKLRIIATVMYLSCPLMILVGFAPTLLLAVGGEYTRSFMRTLIEPVYAAFQMEQVSDRYRATLSGFYSVTWSIGFSIGPAVAGWLQTNINLSTAFVFGACCLATSATMLLFFFGRPRPTGIKKAASEQIL
ncbi:MAG TPA: MFS transporter [Ktedonobacteraceae bacterium]|nr:MFS transporter [Ktedonobacteraceae bacterium]